MAILQANQPLVSVQRSNRVYSETHIAASGTLHYWKSKKGASQRVKTRQQGNITSFSECIRSRSKAKGDAAPLLNGRREQIKHDKEMFEVFNAFLVESSLEKKSPWSSIEVIEKRQWLVCDGLPSNWEGISLWVLQENFFLGTISVHCLHYQAGWWKRLHAQ